MEEVGERNEKEDRECDETGFTSGIKEREEKVESRKSFCRDCVCLWVFFRACLFVVFVCVRAYVRACMLACVCVCKGAGVVTHRAISTIVTPLCNAVSVRHHDLTCTNRHMHT